MQTENTAAKQDEAPVTSLAMVSTAEAAMPEATPPAVEVEAAVAPPATPPEVTPEARAETSTRGYAIRPATVVIDPGHGGPETGAVSKYSDGRTMMEKDLTLAVSLRAADLLRERGYTVFLTRTTDSAVNVEGKDLDGNGKVNVADDLQARIDFANERNADVFVSVHFNAGPSDRRGTEVFYNANRPFSAENKRLAASIYDKLIGGMRAEGYSVVERGVKMDSAATGGAPFYVLGPDSSHIARDGDMPAALGEGLFITNPTEIGIIESEGSIECIARAYADGIHEYLSGQ